MDRKKKSKKVASKQHLIEMGVCKNLQREKNCLFTEEEKRDNANPCFVSSYGQVKKKQPAASKQHLIEMGVCKNLQREKNCLFTEEEKKDYVCKLVAHFLAYLQKNMLSLPVL
jgi:hypothetical protein